MLGYLCVTIVILIVLRLHRRLVRVRPAADLVAHHLRGEHDQIAEQRVQFVGEIFGNQWTEQI